MAKISGPIPISVHWNAPLTPYQRFKRNPTVFMAQYLYSRRLGPSPPPLAEDKLPVKVVCISDTHNKTPIIPDGDILVHAGDLTNKGTFAELQAQLDWLSRLPHAHKIVIAGNHDLLLDPVFVNKFPHRIFEIPGAAWRDLQWGSIIYLSESSTTVTIHGRNIKIFGSP
ncbi:hypothetical protein MMC25_007255 [Agyrium rufum]|nr:hypothetical protein [Agyrium rufum]